MEIIELLIICPICGEQSSIEVLECDLAQYHCGALVQDAFPYLSANERELLITGWCDKCQAKFFGI